MEGTDRTYRQTYFETILDELKYPLKPMSMCKSLNSFLPENSFRTAYISIRNTRVHNHDIFKKHLLSAVHWLIALTYGRTDILRDIVM